MVVNKIVSHSLFLFLFVFLRVKSDCPVPPAPINGLILNTNIVNGTIEDNEKVEFECDENYYLEGKHSIRCFEGEYFYEPPVCIREICPSLPEAVNGKWRTSLRGEYKINAWVRLVCLVGYELVNNSNSKLRCKRNKLELEWQGDIPKCKKRINCGDPGISFDGYREGESFYEGESVSFGCNDEFQLIGEETIVCLGNGNWSHPRPRCRPENTCPDPPQNEFTFLNSDTKTGDFFVLGDEILVTCQPGYRFTEGSPTVFCYQPENEEGEKVGQPIWDEPIIAQCELISCDPPKLPTHGYVKELKNQLEIPKSFPYKFEINFECDFGYRRIGASWSSCEETGWNEKTPYCRKIVCKEPGSPQNGLKSGSFYEIGGKVSFACFSGYRLEGSKERVCLENGKWSGEVTTCSAENWYCPDPGTPESGRKYGNDYERGDVVTFVCDIGYTLMGSATRVCQGDRTWSGTEATCLGSLDFDRPQEVSFRLLSKIDSAVLLQDTDQRNAYGRFARSIDLSYTGGNLVIYFVFDSSGSIGEGHFKSSIGFAKALVQRIGVSHDGVRFGAVTYGATVKSNFYAHINNETESVIEALTEINYVGGGTATSDALKLIRNQHIPLMNAHLKNPKSIVFLVTDGVFNIGGNPKEVAAIMRDEGVEFFCIAVSGKSNMNLKSLKDLATDKSNIYQLHTYETLSWIVDDVLNGSIDYSRCGLSINEMEEVKREARIGSKGKIVQTYWPWMTALLLRIPKNNTIPVHELQCGGSLVDREWILTAAHCLQTKDYKLSFEDVQVKLGLTKLKNETYLQHISAKEIFIHPNYNFSNFDYDVALIKLQHPADYKKQVRPICLVPSENELAKQKTVLYATGESPTVTGFGRIGNKRGQKIMSKELRQVGVEIQYEKNCKDSLKKTKFEMTKNMFCAGDGTGGGDTCKGDSGGPLMQYVGKAEEGYWVQIGIVSWGVHENGDVCGKQGTYGFYTKFSTVVDWVKNIVGKN